MREPDWMFASVVVLGFIAIVLACVYESTYDARHCASDDARSMPGQGNRKRGREDVARAFPILEIG